MREEWDEKYFDADPVPTNLIRPTPFGMRVFAQTKTSRTTSHLIQSGQTD